MMSLVLAVLAAVAVSTAGATRVASGPRVDVPLAVRVAQDLANEPAAVAGLVGVIPSDQAWAEAERRATRIPLPAGGNFNGVRWTTQPELTTAHIEQILEYNALCQWLRARRDRRELSTAEGVLEYAPSWPAMRARARSVVAIVRANDSPMLRNMLADCSRSHTREMAFARSMKLAPSR